MVEAAAAATSHDLSPHNVRLKFWLAQREATSRESQQRKMRISCDKTRRGKRMVFKKQPLENRNAKQRTSGCIGEGRESG